MAILGHGIDLVECDRIGALIEKHPDRFLARILTPAERTWVERFRDPVPHIAGRWAAKEAILKALGTGWRGGIAWTDMEILPDPMGRPLVALSGVAARIAGEMGICRILLSITHTDRHASASAIGVDDPDAGPGLATG